MLGAVVRVLADIMNGTIGDVHVYSARISVDDYSKVIRVGQIGVLDRATGTRAVIDDDVAACGIDCPAYSSCRVDERRCHVNAVAEKACLSAVRQRARDRYDAKAH